jgi:hypothetical protein
MNRKRPSDTEVEGFLRECERIGIKPTDTWETVDRLWKAEHQRQQAKLEKQWRLMAARKAIVAIVKTNWWPGDRPRGPNISVAFERGGVDFAELLAAHGVTLEQYEADWNSPETQALFSGVRLH